MKARRVIDLIRGMRAADAQAVLAFAPQAASEPVGKVLASAIANATNNHAMDARALVVSEAFVDEGPTMKRIRPRAQGRAYRIRKRSSHITVVVTDGRPVVKAEPVRTARATKSTAPKAEATAAPAAKKATAKKADEQSATEPTKKAAAKKAPATKSAEGSEAAKKAPAKKAAATKAPAKKTPQKEG